MKYDVELDVTLSYMTIVLIEADSAAEAIDIAKDDAAEIVHKEHWIDHGDWDIRAVVLDDE